MNIRQLGMIAAVGVAMIATPIAASANGLGENRPWQFRSDSNLAVLLFQAELIEQVRGDMFVNQGPGSVTVHNVQSIGNYNQTTIGDGACNGPHACTVDTDQSNDQSPTTAIGIGQNSTTNGGGSTPSYLN